MFFQQYVLGCLSQLSYLVGDESTGRAVVVDPHRDVSVYLQDATEHGLRIERHRDPRSRRLPLGPPRARRPRSGHMLRRGRADRLRHRILGRRTADRPRRGTTRDPGDAGTRESISVVIYEHRDSAEPFGVLTGDALFIGDVGRPDLLGSAGLSADQLARQLQRVAAREDPHAPGRDAGIPGAWSWLCLRQEPVEQELVDDRRAAGDQLRPGPDERGRVRGCRHGGPAHRAAVFLVRRSTKPGAAATAR